MCLVFVQFPRISHHCAGHQKSLAIRAARKQAKHLVDAMRESINFKSISVTTRKVVKWRGHLLPPPPTHFRPLPKACVGVHATMLHASFDALLFDLFYCHFVQLFALCFVLLCFRWWQVRHVARGSCTFLRDFRKLTRKSAKLLIRQIISLPRAAC